MASHTQEAPTDSSGNLRTEHADDQRTPLPCSRRVLVTDLPSWGSPRAIADGSPQSKEGCRGHWPRSTRVGICVCPAQDLNNWWSGAGSNRRPSAFQRFHRPWTRSRSFRASPVHRQRCWSVGLHRHDSDRAAVCRVIPFRLRGSVVTAPEPGFVGFCGPHMRFAAPADTSAGGVDGDNQADRSVVK